MLKKLSKISLKPTFASLRKMSSDAVQPPKKDEVKPFWAESLEKSAMEKEKHKFFGDFDVPDEKDTVTPQDEEDFKNTLSRLNKTINSITKNSFKHYNERCTARVSKTETEEATVIGDEDQNESSLGSIRKKFAERLDQLGINSKADNDNQMRYEALKREYLRYRMRRNYQKLLELGISNRRPRRVTEMQYKRFKKYRKTNAYDYSRKPGPTYIRGRNGILVRKDIYDLRTQHSVTLQRLAVFDNIPNAVKQPDDLFTPREVADLRDLSAGSLAAAMRRKRFASWERKLDWLVCAMRRLQYSREAYEAMEANILLRLQTLRFAGRKQVFREFHELARHRNFARIFSQSFAGCEANSLRGLRLFAREKIRLLERKRLLLKAEMDGPVLAHSDPFIGSLCHAMRADRERDEDRDRYLKENPIEGRLVLQSNDLQRNQFHLANPDLFLRFSPANWRTFEKEQMRLVNRRERANSMASALMDLKTLGAHNSLWTIFDEPENQLEKDHHVVETEHRLSVEERNILPRIKWTEGILNGSKPRTTLFFNPYLAQMTEEMGKILRDQNLALTISEQFPYGEVDIEPHQFEANYLEKQRQFDIIFSEYIIKWFVSPKLNRNFGHAYNPFRRYNPTLDHKTSYTFKSLPGDNNYETYNSKTTNFKQIKVQTKTVCNRKKEGVMERKKYLVVYGDGEGHIAFTTGVNKAINFRKDVIGIPLYRNRGIYHHTSAKFKSTSVSILSTPVGYGLRGPPLLRNILSLAGIKDASARQHGNNNPTQIVKACFLALGKLTTLHEISWLRGKNLVDVTGDVDGNTYKVYQNFDVVDIDEARDTLVEYAQEHMQNDFFKYCEMLRSMGVATYRPKLNELEEDIETPEEEIKEK